MIKRTVAGAILVLFSGNLPSAQQPEITFKSTELSEGLYMLESEGGFGGGNFALLTGSDGVILIDDALERMAEKVIKAVEAHTQQPVDYLINTHVHGDHIGGNAALRDTGATIITHDNIRHRMIAENIAEAALPEITFSDAVTFHLNGRQAFVFHVSSAHTDGDAVIHFRDDNVIHAGDLMFNGLFPFIDLDSGGSVEGYITGQERILGLADEETRIIPGHGPLASKKDLEAAVEMLRSTYDRVRTLVDAGQSEEDILAANPLKDYHDDWSWEFISTEWMTKTLYRALTDP